MTTLRLMWHQITLVLGTAVAIISSTCTLAFTSALMRVPKTSPEVPPYGSSSAFQKIATSSTCAECDALQYYNNINKPPGYHTTLLEFASDTAVTETIMSFVISFIIVTFALFLAREVR
jgi:hypothetical protein